MSMQISVVVPAYNEEHCIGRCLGSLASEKTAYPFEVIVVDNNCTDRTAAIALANPRVRVVRERQRGLAPARHARQEAACGAVVAHTDADSVLPPDWIERIGRTFERQPELALVSGALLYPEAPVPARLIQGLLNWLTLLWWLMTRRLADVNGCTFAVRAEALAAPGGFALQLPDTGDSRLLSIMKQHGQAGLLRGLPVQTSARRFRGQGVLHVYLFYLLEQLGALLDSPLERVMTAPNVRLPETSLAPATKRRHLLLLSIVPALAAAGGCTTWP
jgi:glycosyltransferase involved in cell wall biosynthesis